MRKYAVDPALPQRRLPVATALADTGLLYTLAHRPKYLEMFLDLYGETVVVATAVAEEIRAVARVPRLERPHQNLVLMGACADRLVTKLDDKIITVREPSENSADLLFPVQQQLRELDRAAAMRRGERWSPFDANRAKRHDGETESILVAADVIKAGGTAILLTNDGGASLTAWQQGVSARNLRNILAELACENSHLTQESLLTAFTEMTAHFGTLPAEVRPTDSSAFRCHALAGECQTCDALTR
ncbi:hypothetical protein [Streptomyces sp. NBC_00328]|uniref:hypothetical protein n=1 Tax=Streptomyces sp. NBC_00328 TaxID=2903646 RepID=UPI002E2B5779|nr:hypothetical protein [Streptomyces sp. NBC_00328]